ncbi:MAG: hypothetical protein K940chlam8_00733 [Chlamydiae bacterium]|nr:hypothetical protein [Chlamydiota bacterium]
MSAPVTEEKMLATLGTYEKFFTQAKADATYSIGLLKLQNYLTNRQGDITQSIPVLAKLGVLNGLITERSLDRHVDTGQLAAVSSLITFYIEGASRDGFVPQGDKKPPGDIKQPKGSDDEGEKTDTPKGAKSSAGSSKSGGTDGIAFDLKTFESVIDASNPVGIVNGTDLTSNNCFLISLVQVIFNTPELRRTFLTQPSQNDREIWQNLALAYAQKIQDPRTKLNVEALRFLLLDKGIDLFNQQDAAQILELMVANINIEHLKSVWTEVLHFDLERAKASEKEDGIKLNDEAHPYYYKDDSMFLHHLPLPEPQVGKYDLGFWLMPQPPSMPALFRDFTTADPRGLDARRVITTNGTVEASIDLHHYKIKALKDFLALQLLRFDNYGNKINASVDAKDSFATGHKLQSFIVHDGYTMKGGHYVSYVKKQDQWYRCDDSQVRPAKEAEAFRAAGDAYLFFYHRNR